MYEHDYILGFLVMNAAAITCILAASVLCGREKGGWGWFLAIGVLLATSSAEILKVALIWITEMLT